MQYRILNLSALVCLALSQATLSDILLETDRSWDGGTLSYPETNPEISSVILKLEEEVLPPFHCHPVPTMGYVLKGVVEVETVNGDRIRLEQGQSVVEVMNTVHRGRSIGGDAEIVVFYAGGKGLPNTVLPAQDPEGHYCTPAPKNSESTHHHAD